MGAKHTPGPWSAESPYVFGPDGSGLCEIYGETTSEEEDAANSALIGAAPELLEQVRLFERTCLYYIKQAERAGDSETANVKRVTLADIQAVIAKATGGQS